MYLEDLQVMPEGYISFFHKAELGQEAGQRPGIQEQIPQSCLQYK